MIRKDRNHLGGCQPRPKDLATVCMRCLEPLLEKFFLHPRKLPQLHTLLVTTGFLLAPWRPRGATFAYNLLIRAYLRLYASPSSALHLFVEMLTHGAHPNRHTFPSLLAAVAFSSPAAGRALHAQTIRRGLVLDDFVSCSLIKFYSQTGHISHAQLVFEELCRPDSASCNAMLDAFCANGEMGSALRLFGCMVHRDVVSWTSLINGFVRNGCFPEAIRLFNSLMHENCRGKAVAVRPNEATLVSVLSACANFDAADALPRGMEIHGHVVRHETRVTAFLATALIDMYGKHGRVGYSLRIFEVVREKEVCTWNAMVSALANNGKEAGALALFDEMRADGLQPNHITFVAVLTACARARLVDAGLRFFELMPHEFGVVPLMEHHGCMVDLLGRAGRLDEAIEFIQRMPTEADASVWGALFGACMVHGNMQLGADVGRRLIELQPWHSGRYMVLRNVYAGGGRWDDAAKLREAMEKAGVKKIAGHSWVNSGKLYSLNTESFS